MKIREGFMLRKVAGKHVVVAIGPASRIFNGMIKLNESGAFCWNQLLTGASEEDMIRGLVSEYGISEEQAAQDVKAFLDTLGETGCLAES